MVGCSSGASEQSIRSGPTAAHGRPSRSPCVSRAEYSWMAPAGVRCAVTSTLPFSPLIDPTVGRGAESATCKHATRSPRCMREGGTAAVVRDHGAARPAEGGDDQTVLLGGEGARPAEVPGRVPGRGGWVSELGPSRA